MNNKELQINLDRKKWFLSEKLNCDMSGCMKYCSACKYRDSTVKFSLDGKCLATQDERVENNRCAQAYNLAKKLRSKEKKQK